MGQNKFLVLKNFGSEKFLARRKFWVLKKFGSPKILDQKKYGLRKKFGTQIILGPDILAPEKFGSRKIFGPKKFLVRKLFWSSSIVQTKLVFMLDMSLEVKLLENGLGGGWLGGWFFTGIKPLRGPTCKLEPARSNQSWITSSTRVWQYIIWRSRIWWNITAIFLSLATLSACSSYLLLHCHHLAGLLKCY